MPSKIEIVQQCLAKWDAGDVDGTHQYATDDFRFEAIPAPEALGYKGVLGKDQHKEFCTKVHKDHSPRKVEVDSITEEGDKVKVKARSKFSYPNGQEEAAFTSVYSFSGNKISHLQTTLDPECVNRFSSLARY